MVHTPDVKKFFGENNRILKSLEQKFGMNIELKQVKFKDKVFDKTIKFSSRVEGNNLYLIVNSELAGKDINVFVEDDLIVTTKVGKKGKIKMNRSSAQAKLIEKGIKENNVKLFL